MDPFTHPAWINAEQGQDAGFRGADKGESGGIHAGDGDSAEGLRRGSCGLLHDRRWKKRCIRMRQDRAESDVIQDTLFGFFSEKGGLKCDSGRRENCNKAFKWLGSENSRGGACDKLIRAVVRIQLVRFNNRLIKACRSYTSKLT